MQITDGKVDLFQFLTLSQVPLPLPGTDRGDRSALSPLTDPRYTHATLAHETHEGLGDEAKGQIRM